MKETSFEPKDNPKTHCRRLATNRVWTCGIEIIRQVIFCNCKCILFEKSNASLMNVNTRRRQRRWHVERCVWLFGLLLVCKKKKKKRGFEDNLCLLEEGSRLRWWLLPCTAASRAAVNLPPGSLEPPPNWRRSDLLARRTVNAELWRSLALVQKTKTKQRQHKRHRIVTWPPRSSSNTHQGRTGRVNILAAGGRGGGRSSYCHSHVVSTVASSVHLSLSVFFGHREQKGLQVFVGTVS